MKSLYAILVLLAACSTETAAPAGSEICLREVRYEFQVPSKSLRTDPTSVVGGPLCMVFHGEEVSIGAPVDVYVSARAYPDSTVVQVYLWPAGYYVTARVVEREGDLLFVDASNDLMWLAWPGTRIIPGANGQISTRYYWTSEGDAFVTMDTEWRP